MIVIKKIMGFHIKQISEKLKPKEVYVKLSKDNNYQITVKIINGKEIEKTVEDKTVFNAIDNAFKQIESEL